MFRNVLPSHFGADLPFKTAFLGEYLLNKIEAGTFTVNRLAERSVAVHDSCHARILGDEIMETARRLYALMGLETREITTDRREGYCCGMAAGCNRYRPDDMYLGAVKALRAAGATGANEIATYCGGCQLTLAMMRWLYPGRQPVRHLMEYLALATGQAPYHPAAGRTLRMLGSVAAKRLSPAVFFQNIPNRNQRPKTSINDDGQGTATTRFLRHWPGAV